MAQAPVLQPEALPAQVEVEAQIRAAPASPGKAPGRLTSLDAYRGFVMFLMMAEVLRFSRMAANFPQSVFWKFLAHHQSHAEWIGCSLHDLIQPSFSFLVGAALPFSLANRAGRGQSRQRMFWHALWRSLVLILLGVFLRSLGSKHTNWTFEDTLSQIGLGYIFLFLLGLRPVRDQWIGLGAILVGYWAAFAWYPLPGPEFDYAAVGASNPGPGVLSGFAAHWNKNSNLASAFEAWLLNYFPRDHAVNGGGYATLSFIPTLGTMILGLIAGGLLKSDRSATEKIKFLMTGGVIGLISGAALGWLGICPMVKRIWTPSWVLFSGGWCFLLTAAFYFVLDCWKRRAWAFPLVVIGMNSIAAYCIAHLFEDFIGKNLATHFGQNFYSIFGDPYRQLFRGGLVLLVMWLILFWMYRRKIFLRI